jgi:CRP-like cAMP-binding protein
MLHSLFDYPDQAEKPQQQDLVFLPHWDDAKWKILLKHTEMRRFNSGDLVVRCGDTDRAFYILIEGSLEILIQHGKKGLVRLTDVSASGAVVGEQAFLDGKPRSATLRATTDGVLLSVSLDAFDALVVHEPELARDILMDLARTLSVKLRLANAFISKYIK